MSSDNDENEIGSLDDDYSGDEPEMQAEMHAFDRVGFNEFDFVGNIPKTRLEHAMQEPIEKFKQYVKAISHNLKSKNVIITNNQIQEMLDSADELKNVEHKNPTAYILGFLANKMEIDSGDPLEYVIQKVLIHADEEASVQAHDVIRYSRLWENILSKKHI